MRKLTNRALFICLALMTSFCLIAPATALRSYAQEGGGSTLEGLIKDDSGPLLGATVIVKNTTRGTTTDMDGKFRLEGLQPGDVLQVTYVGYDPYEVTYTGQTTLDILMTTTANQLNAVVVTAMGIERQSKTLSYAAETVGGDDVADIKSVNMINALQGKAAGHLHGEMLHAQHTPCGFAADGKGIRQDVIQRFALGQLLLKGGSLRLQVGIGHGLILGLQRQHLFGDGIYLFQLPVREAAKKFFNKGHRSHLINLKNRAVMRPGSRITIQVYDTPKRQTRQTCKAILARFYMNFL